MWWSDDVNGLAWVFSMAADELPKPASGGGGSGGGYIHSSKKNLLRNNTETHNGGRAKRVNAWADFMRASSPARIFSLSETDDHKPWICKPSTYTCPSL